MKYILTLCLLFAPFLTPANSPVPIHKKRLWIRYTGQTEQARRICNMLINAGVRDADSISVLLASAITETGWGTSDLYRNHNNLFGIVWTGKGAKVVIKGIAYRSYTDKSQCIAHRLRFRNDLHKMSENPEYEQYVRRFAKKLKKHIKIELQ